MTTLHSPVLVEVHRSIVIPPCYPSRFHHPHPLYPLPFLHHRHPPRHCRSLQLLCSLVRWLCRPLFLLCLHRRYFVRSSWHVLTYTHARTPAHTQYTLALDNHWNGHTLLLLLLEYLNNGLSLLLLLFLSNLYITLARRLSVPSTRVSNRF